MIFNMGGGGVVPKENLDATTIIPGTENQVISSGTYLKGDLTVLGDADLVAENIVKNKNIFGVEGTGIGYGIIIDEFTDSTKAQPKYITVNVPTITKDGAFATGSSSGYAYNRYFATCLVGITIKEICEEIAGYAFQSLAPSWLKSKAKKLNAYSYGMMNTGSNPFYVWLGKETETVNGPSYTSSPFYNNNALKSGKIYCEAKSKPTGWGEYWNSISYDGTMASVMWGVTEETFDNTMRGKGL